MPQFRSHNSASAILHSLLFPGELTNIVHMKNLDVAGYQDGYRPSQEAKQKDTKPATIILDSTH